MPREGAGRGDEVTQAREGWREKRAREEVYGDQKRGKRGKKTTGGVVQERIGM